MTQPTGTRAPSLPGLVYWRREASLSQRELAARSGVAYVTIARIESGHGGPPYPSTVRKLASALGVKPRDLLHGPRAPDGDDSAQHRHQPTKSPAAPATPGARQVTRVKGTDLY